MEPNHRPDPAQPGGSPPGDLDRGALLQQLEQRTRELEECRTRFHNAIVRAADGVVIADEQGTIQFVNPAAERLFNRSASDLVGQDFGFPLTLGETAEIELVRRDGGEVITAELRVADTEWSGAPARLISVRDVTDRKKAEERARGLLLERAARKEAERAHHRSRFLSEASAILDASLQLDGTLTGVAELLVPDLAEWCIIDVVESGSVRRVAAVHEDSAMQEVLTRLAERFPPDAAFARLAGDEGVAASGAILLDELDENRLREITRDPTYAQGLAALRTRSLIAVPLGRRDERLGLLMLACDQRDFDADDVALAEEVAARASRAIENARLYQAALAASKAKSDFLAIMSHELRTPLNAIIGYTDMLVAEVLGSVDERQTSALQRIDASARHLIQIIDEILTHAGLEAGRAETRPERLTVHALVDTIVAIAEPLVGENDLKFRVSVSDPDAELVADASRIRQIVLNLLSNAVRFTLTGTVDLRVDVVDEDLVIAVQDTGIGIDAEDLEHIFEPFWQKEQPLTRRTGGTGLGLSVSRRLVEVLGGKLTVESEPGAGSTFTIRVPVNYSAPRDDAALQTEQEPADP